MKVKQHDVLEPVLNYESKNISSNNINIPFENIDALSRISIITTQDSISFTNEDFELMGATFEKIYAKMFLLNKGTTSIDVGEKLIQLIEKVSELETKIETLENKG